MAQFTNGVAVGATVVVLVDGVGVGVAVELVCALMETTNANTSSNTAQNFKLLMTV